METRWGTAVVLHIMNRILWLVGLYVEWVHRMLRPRAMVTPAWLHNPRVLWRSGYGPYATLRIPALCATRKTLVAFCEGRRRGPLDSGDIDVLCRRSVDDGRTWDAPTIVCLGGGHTFGNPCAVTTPSGAICLLVTHNDGRDSEALLMSGQGWGRRQMFVCRSEDDGRTWSEPHVLDNVLRPEWRWCATGPGAGICVQQDPSARNRLIIPCNHRIDAATARSHVIYSDDDGRTWLLGGASPAITQGVDGTTRRLRSNECQLIERVDGSIMMSVRSLDDRAGRWSCVSHDGGNTFEELKATPGIEDPGCHAAMIKPDAGQPFACFANPACSNARRRMTLRWSHDDGVSWTPGVEGIPHAGTPSHLGTQSVLLHAGPSAYASLCSLPGSPSHIGCLYEAGTYHPYECLVYQRVAYPITHKKNPRAE